MHPAAELCVSLVSYFFELSATPPLLCSFSTLLRLFGHCYWLLSSFHLSSAVRRSLSDISGGCFLVTTPDPWNEGILLHPPGSSSTGPEIKGVCCQFTVFSSVWSGRTVLRNNCRTTLEIILDTVLDLYLRIAQSRSDMEKLQERCF
ncbi:hypothetical protein T4B_2660 [Trichinella pseudospiralis]|uniref:Uncharacterized protein n=1 Tax=Trichinella pseudospiralis TaxID=6337 RepID=A0A0V1EET8_TRIPS|nr:hypothetical protein T4E_5821 [Trichinella pseudospiralis]KRY71667.1 hypothetical protein T4A_10624 [Trichinella pseudospiralis]KRZ31193.1 hypothetical protein T4B_2660 [Trichinella pseudospiralis]